MRTSPATKAIRPIQTIAPRPSGPDFVADDALMLMLLAEGQNLVRMSRSAGWPARQIHLFASRHGYLFAVDGVPYQPPASGEQPRVARRAERSAS